MHNYFASSLVILSLYLVSKTLKLFSDQVQILQKVFKTFKVI